MRFEFIEARRDEFPVWLMCKVPAVSPGGYYARRNRPVSAQKMANQTLWQAIETVYEESKGTYGSPRVYRAVRKTIPCSENRVARLMKKHGLQARRSRRFKRTTRVNEAHAKAANVLAQDFSAPAPNQNRTVDITYIATGEGRLYPAVVIDLFSRRIVGWAMAARMTVELAQKAPAMAFRQRNPPGGLLHHSDRGSQYTATGYQQLLKNRQCQISMSGTGNCYDNAPAESFFGSLKTDRVHHTRYQTRNEARTDIFFYIEGWYNTKRLHSSLGYLSPAAFEAAYHARTQSGLTLCPL